MVQNFGFLANAVVKQAAEDYRDALCNYHNTGREEYDDEIKRLERFFRGETMMRYTELDGEVLIEGIQKQVIAFDYDLKAIKKSLLLSQQDANEEES